MINNYLFLFMYDIGLYLGKMIDLDIEFYQDIVNFLLGIRHDDEKDVISKMLCIGKEISDGDKIVFPVPNDSDKLANYMNMVISDDKRLASVFNQVGFEDAQKIAKLTEGFVSYLYVLADMKKKRLRS